MIIGVLLNQYSIGSDGFSVFGSVGNYFIWAGMGMLIATIVMRRRKKEKIVDERMEFVAAKAMRMTFVVFVATAFVVMVIDGIEPIKMPYHLFMSYLVSGMLAVLYVSYKILLKFY
jgi:uncharacterized membrane protein